MKTLLTVLVCFLAIPLSYSQNVPQGINYQAVARDGSGAEITNQQVGVKIDIRTGLLTYARC